MTQQEQSLQLSLMDRWPTAKHIWKQFRKTAFICVYSAQNRDYLATKADDFRIFTRVGSIGALLFVPLTLIVDYAISSHLGPTTYLYTLAEELVLLLWCLAAWRNLDSLNVRVWSVLTPLVLVACTIGRFSLLEQGSSFGIAALLYFFIFVPLLLLSQPVWLPVLVLVLVILLPMALASFGFTAGFDWLVYNTYMWLAFGPVVPMLIMFEALNWSLWKQRRKIEVAATIDNLTRTANRSHFLEEAKRSLAFHARKQRPIALLFIDIDHFKSTNDTYGHRVGDEALKRIAATLEREKREEDLIGRYGGDEILLLLSETELDAARTVAERMREAVAGLVVETDDHRQVGLSVSIGVAALASPTEDGVTDIDSLIHVADLALYEVKEAGRNGVVSRVPERAAASATPAFA